MCFFFFFSSSDIAIDVYKRQIADNEKNAALYAGQIRTALGERLDLIEKNSFKFCYINDFPMYEYDKETKKMEFTHNPFSMPQGGLCLLYTSRCV